jgi:hypothetical protein
VSNAQLFDHTPEDLFFPGSRVLRAARGGWNSALPKVGYDAFEISACWAPVPATGAAHRVHHHPNNYLSAVYYLRAHPGVDTTAPASAAQHRRTAVSVL